MTPIMKIKTYTNEELVTRIENFTDHVRVMPNDSDQEFLATLWAEAENRNLLYKEPKLLGIRGMQQIMAIPEFA